MWSLRTGLNQGSNVISKMETRKRPPSHTCLQALNFIEGLSFVFHLNYCCNHYGFASLSTKYGGFHNFPVNILVLNS